MTQLTQEQARAVQERRVSVALSAGAGCGKTHVLTQRFLSYLDPEATGGQPTRLSELVAITFTERAAREMRVRIRRACRARLLAAPDDSTASYWLSLVRELDSARISTIHSFCRQLLQRYAVEAGLDPHFRVLEEAEAETLLLSLLDDVFRRRLTQQQEPFLDLLASYRLENLRDMVLDLVEDRLQIDFAYWTQRTPEELVQHWEKLYHEWFSAYRMEFHADQDVQNLLQLIRSGKKVSEALRRRWDQIEGTLKALPHTNNLQADIHSLQENAKVQGLTAKSHWPDEDFYTQYKEAAKKFRDSALKKLETFSRWPEPSELEALARKTLHLASLAYEVFQEYEEEKRRQSALDFDDLVAEAVRLLQGPFAEDIRRQLAAQIQHLLVDEFQDTDPTQVRLMELLCGEDFLQGKLFFVGDYKQSIYRFRGARPEEFHRLRSNTPQSGRLSLTVNFRSQPGILDFVNALFCEEFNRLFSEKSKQRSESENSQTPAEEQYEPLRPHRPQLNPEPIVEFLWAKAEENLPAEEESEEPAEEADSTQESEGDGKIRRREADWIARRIRQLLDSGQPLVRDEQSAKQGQERLRPPQPGDIAILFRTLSDVSLYEEALRQYEIPYYLVGGHAFYAQQEIYDLVNLLRAIQSPLDAVALVGVLRSPFFNLHDETLYWLGKHPEGLWAGLCAQNLPAELEPAQRRQVRFAASLLQTLRANKDRLPIAELVQQALQQTGYQAAVLAEFLGQRKLANLQKLLDLARRMDQTGLFSLADFILQLSEFVSRQPKEPLAATLPETCEVVRLMTIHQAKGLEFPIVIVANLDRKIRGSTAAIAFDPSYGPILKPPSDFDKEKPSVWDLYWHEQHKAEREESMRIFYVAATRAADYLILSAGWGKKTLCTPWMQLLDKRFNLQTGQLKVSLPERYPAPAIRVTQTEPSFPGQVGSGRSRRYLEDLLRKTDQTLTEGGGRIPPHLGPIRPDPKSPRRYSFSRLSGQLHAPSGQEDATESLPTYGAEASLGRAEALELGILIHAVLAQIDYSTPDGLAELADRLAFRHLGHLSAEQAARIQQEAVEILKKFLVSERAAKIASAQKLYREVEFLLAWSPGTPQTVPTSSIQGFLDCLYQDSEGRWHVVDFKTHQIEGRNVRQLAAPYELQMLLYALAFQEIFGVAPAELVIYFLRAGKEFVFTWTETCRQWVIEQISQAIEQVRESAEG